MEKILTIIAEYNPLHFGHLYQLEKSIKIVNPEYKIAIISGNFVQRGEPSIINKWEKAKIALHYGFDLVIELPTIYAISSAENFSYGAISIANQLGTTHLSFGSEIGKIDRLNKLLELIENSKEFDEEVKNNIVKGFSYPKSQELAIEKLFNDDYKNICKPNNVLGLEYLKSLKKINSSSSTIIEPITIKRNLKYNSSSQIREKIRNNLLDDDSLPDYCQDIIEENKNNGKIIYSLRNFEKEIIYTIRRLSIEKLSAIPDVSENIIKKIYKAANSCNTIEELIEKIKNKSITQARIQRILLYILLNITKDDMEMSKSETPYVRVLGMNEKGKKLLSKISNGNYNIITSFKSYEKRCTNSNLQRLLEIDKFATNVYTLAFEGNSESNLDYTTKLINID